MKGRYIMPVINMKETGFRIRQCMDEKQITVHQLQRMFEFQTPQAIYKWLRGTSLPTIDNIVILASILDIAVDELLVTEII